MATTLEQHAILHRLPHRAAKIDAGDRTARTRAGAAGLQRNRKGRTAIALLQTRRHQPDDAGMPTFRCSDDNGTFLFQSERCECLGFGLSKCRLLDLLAFTIEPVEFGGNACRFARIFLEKKAHAEIGSADAATGIDARAQQKSEMPRFRRAAEARHIHKRGCAQMLAAPECNEPLGDESAIETFERHHVGDGTERNEMQ